MSNVTPLAGSLQRTLSTRSLPTIKEDMEDKQLFMLKDQAETGKASPSITEANDGSELMMITIGHCRNLVPAVKYHAELEMTSRPMMSQKEYEESIMKSVIANNK